MSKTERHRFSREFKFKANLAPGIAPAVDDCPLSRELQRQSRAVLASLQPPNHPLKSGVLPARLGQDVGLRPHPRGSAPCRAPRSCRAARASSESASAPGLVSIAYTAQSGKDGLGRRVQIASTPQGGGAATTTNYVWCGFQLCQARTAAGAQALGYYAEGEYVPGSGALYYAPDNLGSVRRVFSASASPSYDYDPFGAPNQATAPVTDFAYAGMVYNADSGLYLTTHRPYDPATGRFLSRDPIGEDGDPEGNLYAYVGGEPVTGTDSSGLFTIAVGPVINFIFGQGYTAGAGFYFTTHAAYGGPDIGFYSTVGTGLGIDVAAQGQISYTPGSLSNFQGPFSNTNVGGPISASGSEPTSYAVSAGLSIPSYSQTDTYTGTYGATDNFLIPLDKNIWEHAFPGHYGFSKRCKVKR